MSDSRAATDCPVPNCGCHYHAEEGTLCEFAKKEAEKLRNLRRVVGAVASGDPADPSGEFD